MMRWGDLELAKDEALPTNVIEIRGPKGSRYFRIEGETSTELPHRRMRVRMFFRRLALGHSSGKPQHRPP